MEVEGEEAADIAWLLISIPEPIYMDLDIPRPPIIRTAGLLSALISGAGGWYSSTYEEKLLTRFPKNCSHNPSSTIGSI